RPSEPQLNLLDSRAVEPDVYEAARDLISETIDAIGHERQRPTDFPESALPLFNAFGSSLRDDERIVVHIPNGGPNGRKTSYDRKTRKRLVLLREQTYQDDVDIVGAVVQFDPHKMLFE